MDKKDYKEFLRDGETLETVLIGTLRKRAFDARQRMSEVDRERLKEQQLEQAEELRQRQYLDICFWAETGFRHPAETAAEEIACHRKFLKAFGDVPDVIEGESLRRLAKRTLIRLCKYGGYGSGNDVWVSGYSNRNRKFCFEGFTIRNMSPDWFENNWVLPSDMTEMEADLPIDVSALESWPDFGRVNAPDKKPKPSVAPSPPVFEVPNFMPSMWGGYSTRDHLPDDARKYLNAAN
jgi:hypothetical protein